MDGGMSGTQANVTAAGWWRRHAATWGAMLFLGLVAGCLRFWALPCNGFGNLYYAAAVRSMAASWHGFLFASFDPAGFLALDKPPGAFWIQALGVRCLGWEGWVLHVPQAVEGVLAVWLVYALTRRAAGPWPALAAGLVLAFSPANVAVDRSNLPDTCLLLVLLAAAWAALRAAERGSWKWLWTAAALVGLGFNVKWTAAWLVVPAFGALYWLTSGVGRVRRLVHLVGALAILVGTSLSWAVLVDATPAEQRPYVGDTPNNSAISLALGVQGASRIMDVGAARGGRFRSGDGPADPQRRPAKGGPFAPKGQPPFRTGGPPGFPGPGGPPGAPPLGPPSDILTGHGGSPGLLRLVNRDLAGHIAWLLPLALVGCVAAWLMARRDRTARPANGSSGDGSQTDGTGAATSPGVHAVMHRTEEGRSLVLWGLWLAAYAVAFSFTHPPIHPYYTTLLAAPLACLVGLSLAALGRASAGGRCWTLLPAAAIAATVAWEGWIMGYCPTWQRWLLPIAATGAAMSVVLLGCSALPRAGSKGNRYLAAAALAIGFAAVLLGPAAWSLTPVLAPGPRMVPLADPVLLTREAETDAEGDPWDAVARLGTFLGEHASTERFLLAAPDVNLSSPVITFTGRPVLAWGGFLGTDPILTAERFAEMVAAGEVRFVLLREAGPPGRGRFGPPGRGLFGPPGRGPLGPPGRGASTAPNPLADWVRAHGHRVADELWRAPPQQRRPGGPMSGWGEVRTMLRMIYASPQVQLYDCRPSTEEKNLKQTTVGQGPQTAPQAGRL